MTPSLARLARSRWAGLGLALLAGAGAGLAHPPFGFLPGLLGFGLLLHLLDGSDGWKRAFARGWAAGFAYFMVGTWWVGEAFMVDAAAHGWQAPFAVLLLAGGLALFWGVAGVVYSKIAPPGSRRVLVFAAVLALFEWLRGHVMTGFPWDLPGEAWKAGSAPSQTAALVGAYGLSLITLAIAATPGLGWRPRPLIAAFAVLALMWGGGAWRLSHSDRATTNLLVRMVQPDIPQAVKWSPAEFGSIVQRYMALTAAAPQVPGARRPDVVVWPEAALPAPAEELLSPDWWVRPMLEKALQPGQTLLMGAYRTEGPDSAVRYYNSLFALRRTAQGLEETGRYDKHKLVPFGEYLPVPALFAYLHLSKLVSVGDGFTAGPAPAPISPAGLPRLQPLICYESLYPGLTHDGGQRPEWIVNVSNDAWFGRTSGPWQHFNQASYRAIETGLPLIRATPTGVSGVIDSYGRPLQRFGPGRSGVVDALLPKAAAATFYSNYGDTPFFVLLALGLVCSRRHRVKTGL